MKPPHRRGSYAAHAAAVRRAAYADPATKCWRCGRTLLEHGPTKTGKPPTWEAGHLIDSQPGGTLLPEVKSCNASAGATYGNQRRRRTPLAW